MKISKPDWVGLRCLYLLLASDTSTATIKEVQRILRYYQDKYTTEGVTNAMGKLVRDNALRGTFNVPEAAISRQLNNSIKQHLEDNWMVVRDVNLDGRVK